MLHEEQRSRGLLAPRTPRGRAISPAPVLRLRKLNEQGFSACGLGKTEREPTGVMKTMKKVGGKASFPIRPFFMFSPDAKHPAGGVSHRQPVARSAGTQFAKFQSFFCKGASAWQLCRTQFAKTHSFSAKVCVHVTLFHRETVCVKQIAISGNGCRVNDPGGVQGQSPAWFPTHHRETVCFIQIVISGERVQG